MAKHKGSGKRARESAKWEANAPKPMNSIPGMGGAADAAGAGRQPQAQRVLANSCRSPRRKRL